MECDNIIDYSYKIATVIIALMNFIYIWKINLLKQDKEEEKRKEERNINLLKTLVLDYNLKYLYEFFDALEMTLIKLKSEQSDKKTVEKEIQAIFKDFNYKFIFLLKSTATSIGNDIETISDDMRDTLIQNIADDGYNLYVEHCYNDKIKVIYDNNKKRIINTLFSYQGN